LEKATRTKRREVVTGVTDELIEIVIVLENE